MVKEIKPPTTFDEFSKMDIRTATILSAEPVPKTDKLLKLVLDTGTDTRTVVSGIAAFYKPADIIGHKVCLLANLEPRTIKGILSQGMILMAEDAKGELSFVSPTKNEFENGSVVR
jgi:methionyl-tRNA synthetase